MQHLHIWALENADCLYSFQNDKKVDRAFICGISQYRKLLNNVLNSQSISYRWNWIFLTFFMWWQVISTEDWTNGAAVVYRPNVNTPWILVGIASGRPFPRCLKWDNWAYPTCNWLIRNWILIPVLKSIPSIIRLPNWNPEISLHHPHSRLSWLVQKWLDTIIGYWW